MLNQVQLLLRPLSHPATAMVQKSLTPKYFRTNLVGIFRLLVKIKTPLAAAAAASCSAAAAGSPGLVHQIPPGKECRGMRRAHDNALSITYTKSVCEIPRRENALKRVCKQSLRKGSYFLRSAPGN